MNLPASLCRAFLALSFVLLSHAAFAALPTVPYIAAKSYVLLDYSANQMLATHNASERVEPASLTKLMTAYLVFAALKDKRITPEQSVTVSERAWKTSGSRLFIEPKRPVTVDDLVRGMIAVSGNDASVALAELIGGSEEAFAQLMNREAQRLGMLNTRFMNATGLPDSGHYSTAWDLALLAAAIVRDYPEYYPLYSLKEFRYNNITQPNRNRLLWSDPAVDGMKTGYTDAAGYCLVTSAKRADRRLISVVLGTDSESARATESQKLINYGFQSYDDVKFYAAGQPVSNVPVWKGAAASVKAGFTDDLRVALPKGIAGTASQNERVVAQMESTQPLIAPVAAGQKVGVLRLTLDGKPFLEYTIVALEAVAPAGIFGRAWDTVRLWFKSR
jgi:D-alanyl-D-alanine carboxypeptidase (penicillin-binding protein 5/6)